jgi:predicted RecB family nuclease
MPLTAAQTTAFFEDTAQMGIPNATVVQLQVEGITSVYDLADFDKDTVEQIAANLRRPAGRIVDPNTQRLQVRRFRLRLLCLERNHNSD